MTAEHDTSTTPMGHLEEDATWYYLYQMLRKPVQYWVYTHIVPSWVGQEGDIIEDVIQETVLRVWKHHCKGEQVEPVNSLLQFSKTTALNYCKDLQRHDHRLTPTRDLHECSILVFEIGEDPQDIAVEHIWQDELFVCAANAITKFPAKQRKALLTDLACRMDFHGSPTPLQRAFSRAGVRLEDYQQPYSRDAVERNRYLTSLSTAYKRLRGTILAHEADPDLNQSMNKKRNFAVKHDINPDSSKTNAQISMFLFVPSSLEVERISSQVIVELETSDTERYEAFKREITHMDMDKSEKEHADDLKEQDAPMILKDPELAKLALHLRQTPSSRINPAYREALQSKLLEIVLPQRQRESRDETGGVGTDLETNSEESTLEGDPKKSINEPDTSALEDDVELSTLARYLEQVAPMVPIDPRFQEALQEKLLEFVRRSSGAVSKIGSQGILALNCNRTGNLV